MYCAKYKLASHYASVYDGGITGNSLFTLFRTPIRKKSARLSVQAYPDCLLPVLIYRAKSIFLIGLLALFFCVFFTHNISKEML